ncbi:hypothetical protein PRIPAC_78826 [Pristionchus pacificus]|uniref:Uncharacterized protein n=1 Tax=Pristionchus pacificus TaxID=54126 RepID=A0A2A6CBU6_PRIPA|nr:hypothetical protein PRIPAC_78826 [Pristionchus pacificus]|eukprot:PDM75523.1 hypothetical protein PRIPAC_42700 [Pristionchus pacificus]
MNGLIIVGLLSFLLAVSSSAPLDFEKQFLYSFQDPSEFELIAPAQIVGSSTFIGADRPRSSICMLEGDVSHSSHHTTQRSSHI